MKTLLFSSHGARKGYSLADSQQTRPLATLETSQPNKPEPSIPSTKFLVSASVTALVVLLLGFAGVSDQHELSTQAALTLTIFVVAIWAWIFSPLSDTYVALTAALSLVLTGVLPLQSFTATLGNKTIWLLVAAFIMAAGVSASGLATRLTMAIITRARSIKSLFYCLTFALFLTAFFIPSTSGRAALALPVFTALAAVLKERTELVKAISLLIPSVILLSAVSSYIGAGAHLITDEILSAAGLETIGFARWMLLGSGLGILSSLFCCALVLGLFVPKDQRRQKLSITAQDFQENTKEPISSTMSKHEKNVLWVLCAVVLAWSTQNLHGLDTVTVALMGALLMSAPGISGVGIADGIKKAPWPLLIFMAATLALGTALVDSGAANWVAQTIFSPLSGGGAGVAIAFIVLTTILSTAAHLMIQSRSARSAVLIPIVITAAIPLGVNPVAAAFISTAAAGFCHTLTSSAKPVALYSQVKDLQVYSPQDLLRLSAWLAPLHVGLILLFAFIFWPLLGLSPWL